MLCLTVQVGQNPSKGYGKWGNKINYAFKF